MIIMAFTMMGIIFLFSSCNADVSSMQSDMIVKLINNVIPINSFFVRKLAHFSLFFILELILFLTFKNIYLSFKSLPSSLVITSSFLMIFSLLISSVLITSSFLMIFSSVVSLFLWLFSLCWFSLCCFSISELYIGKTTTLFAKKPF